jgi:hypothetical protein
MHVCNGNGFVEDEEGTDLPDIETARARAIQSARAIMADDLRGGELDLSSFIEVEDEGGELLFSLSFSEAVALKREYDGQRPTRRARSEAYSGSATFSSIVRSGESPSGSDAAAERSIPVSVFHCSTYAALTQAVSAQTARCFRNAR